MIRSLRHCFCSDFFILFYLISFDCSFIWCVTSGCFNMKKKTNKSIIRRRIKYDANKNGMYNSLCNAIHFFVLLQFFTSFSFVDARVYNFVRLFFFLSSFLTISKQQIWTLINFPICTFLSSFWFALVLCRFINEKYEYKEKCREDKRREKCHMF